mmetsp:Transcript_6782/g.27771  ORF Transcript_6782/g.27771 Transcript_6782/m.27771 type:complete len:202 (-) Transcript_6782:4946-5551(-)
MTMTTRQHPPPEEERRSRAETQALWPALPARGRWPAAGEGAHRKWALPQPATTMLLTKTRAPRRQRWSPRSRPPRCEWPAPGRPAGGPSTPWPAACGRHPQRRQRRRRELRTPLRRRQRCRSCRCAEPQSRSASYGTHAGPPPRPNDTPSPPRCRTHRPEPGGRGGVPPPRAGAAAPRSSTTTPRPGRRTTAPRCAGRSFP